MQPFSTSLRLDCDQRSRAVDRHGFDQMRRQTNGLVRESRRPVAGLAGAHVAASASHEHRFGWIGHSLVGLTAGALSGYFLQTIALTLVTAGGTMTPPTAVEAAVIEGLTGGIVGAIGMAAVGFLINANSTKA